MVIKCVKNATRLLDIDCVNKQALYLSKEVLWISVGQLVEKLQAWYVYCEW